MCTVCGCGHVGAHHHDLHHERAVRRRTIRLERDLLEHNQSRATETRGMLDARSVRMLNLIGGPGAGKTALLEATIPRLREEMPIAVLEGDQATQQDAERIARTGCRVVQVNTGPGCHLDAEMVHDGLSELAPSGGIVFVENVGNLVCPALFDVGEHAKVVVMSVTEGADKPLKYPHVFRAAELFVLTKVDLLPYVELDVERCFAHARSVNPDLCILRVSSTTGLGLDDWLRWLRSRP